MFLSLSSSSLLVTFPSLHLHILTSSSSCNPIIFHTLPYINRIESSMKNNQVYSLFKNFYSHDIKDFGFSKPFSKSQKHLFSCLPWVLTLQPSLVHFSVIISVSHSSSTAISDNTSRHHQPLASPCDGVISNSTINHCCR